MMKLVSAVKTVLLATALLVVAWSALPDQAKADSVTCEAAGHSCHAIIDGQTYHLGLARPF